MLKDLDFTELSLFGLGQLNIKNDDFLVLNIFDTSMMDGGTEGG